MNRLWALLIMLAVVGLMSGCDRENAYTQKRLRMVSEQIEARGIKQEELLAAMREVPRHRFVPLTKRWFAYQDRPLPIKHGQTISQPYIVALMTELADIDDGDVVLEVGTGSGYQAAILSVMAKQVYSIEYITPLGQEAKQRLQELGYENVTVKVGDGYKGWPEHQPFDAIIVTAGIDHVPKPLLDQLKVGGRLVIPVGKNPMEQQLLVILKDEKGKLSENYGLPVKFVPFLGPHATEEGGT